MNQSDSVLTKRQVRTYGSVPCPDQVEGSTISASVRFDDDCGNGHNTFAITGHMYIPGSGSCGGCLHEEITKYIPKLAPLIKWHLCSTDGPMHYPANAIYFAGDRDCHGLLKGEFRQLVDRKSGLPVWELNIPDEYKHFGSGYCRDSAECPDPVRFYYKPYGRTGEGKKRELDCARSSAIWPDATDEDLIAPGLEERLKARLPQLMKEFREAVESLGFTW